MSKDDLVSENEWSDISESRKSRILDILNSVSAKRTEVIDEDQLDDEDDKISEDALREADNLILRIKEFNRLDYSSKRDEIAREFDEVLWDGEWDTTLQFVDLPSIRLIQEDEYDQHMDDDEKLDFDLQVNEHYVFFIK